MITGPTAEGKLSNRKETLSENIKLYDRVCTHVSSVSSNNFHLEVRPLDNTQEHTTINSFRSVTSKVRIPFFLISLFVSHFILNITMNCKYSFFQFSHFTYSLILFFLIFSGLF